MARGDILPFRSSGGGAMRTRSARMDATADFDEGDVVAITAAGDVIESITEVDPALTIETVGVAAVASQSVANARTGDGLLATAATNGEQIQYYAWGDLDTEWITKNGTADDDAVLDEVPLESQIGDECNLRTGSGLWGISIHASGDHSVFTVTDVLDAQKVPVGISGNAGVYWVFVRRTL